MVFNREEECEQDGGDDEEAHFGLCVSRRKGSKILERVRDFALRMGEIPLVR